MYLLFSQSFARRGLKRVPFYEQASASDGKFCGVDTKKILRSRYEEILEVVLVAKLCRHEASTHTRIVFAHRICRFHSGCFCSSIHYDDIIVKKNEEVGQPGGYDQTTSLSLG